MNRFADPTRQELDQAFRLILRAAGVKGILAGHVADLIDAVELVLSRSPLSTEDVRTPASAEQGCSPWRT
jgi:hypothetical protein